MSRVRRKYLRRRGDDDRLLGCWLLRATTVDLGRAGVLCSAAGSSGAAGEAGLEGLGGEGLPKVVAAPAHEAQAKQEGNHHD